MTAYEPHGIAPRRLVLIDFDWQDADLVPDLIRTPGVSVRLVSGSGPDDAGIRVAELCGLPCSVELADLTREIFDVALLGERSARRHQIERLLRALGTPVRSPVAFVANGGVERRLNGSSHAEPEPLWSDASDALPDASMPTWADAPELAAPTATEPLPMLDDALGLERLLTDLARSTSAFSAELHRVEGDRLTRALRIGHEDGLLETLVTIAHRVSTPQVVRRSGGPQDGRVWGAWPIRGGRGAAVLAVSAADSATGQAMWEGLVERLAGAWSEPWPAAAGASPLNALEPGAFAHRLEMAVERHRADGFRFALHRLRFDAPAEVVDALTRALPERLRGTDAVCRVGPGELLVLCAGPAGAFLVVRARVQSLWEQCWTESGRGGRAPELADDRLEIREQADVRAFLSTAHGWLARA